MAKKINIYYAYSFRPKKDVEERINKILNYVSEKYNSASISHSIETTILEYGKQNKI